MRNSFAIGPQKTMIGADFSRFAQIRAASLNQLAVVRSSTGEMVVAAPRQDKTSRTFEIDIMRFPKDFALAALQTARKASAPTAPDISESTFFLTPVQEFAERTRILALDGEQLALSDSELAAWLVEAEQQIIRGTDGHPLFETSLEETACTIRRLPNGQVSMTEVRRAEIADLREKVAAALGGRAPGAAIDLRVETPLRCVARYFLTGLPEGDAARQTGKEREVTAFLQITRAGFSYGLWSPATGLFSEYAFLAPSELNPTARKRTEMAVIAAMGTVQTADDGGSDGDRLDAYIRRALDQFYLQLTQEQLDRLQLAAYARVVWAAEYGLASSVAPIVDEYSERTGLDFFHIDAPADEAIASGLLFGSFTFGDVRVAGAEILPPVDLAHDLLVQASNEEIGRQHAFEAGLQARRNKAVLSLLAAPAVVLALMLGIVVDQFRSELMTKIREVQADQQTAELKPALDRRKAYEASLKWYQEFITQVSRLRRQQPVGIGLLQQLNSNYPFSIDPTFYISDLRLTPEGAVEMKGYARNKDAIATFLKALEFAGGPESGSRLFSNLAYEVQEAAPVEQQVPGQQLPTMPGMKGSALNTAAVAPGVISWTVKGNYIPMAEFQPKPDPKKNGKPANPATPAAPNASPAQPKAAA